MVSSQVGELHLDPPFSFDGYWLYSPQNKQNAIIHIFGEEASFNNFSSKANNGLLDHIAFSREGYSNFIQHITHLKISFEENFVPDSNTKQVFLKGPENLTIEIDFIQRFLLFHRRKNEHIISYSRILNF
ncbi:hypothetical protein [Bathymodiolus heckerae thiotrophic gill symbiont]|uniref:hypothetical protein n=1 Tax=Bathymodiolus heckerae thiotrophic gill symbiont TaxID=1052212 RepID=UPI001BB253A4|nr:hypothetical protein [Bathymodiolus heckerae thiotrophic gill symbiont]